MQAAPCRRDLRSGFTLMEAVIALSILAAVVRAVRMDGLVAAPNDDTGAAPPPPAKAVDPICGMTVVAAPPTLSLEVDGTTHWFCNPRCRDQFATASAGAGSGRPG